MPAKLLCVVESGERAKGGIVSLRGKQMESGRAGAHAAAGGKIGWQPLHAEDMFIRRAHLAVITPRNAGS